MDKNTNSFLEFVNREDRENRRKLNILHRVFEAAGIPSKNYLKENNPYIFVPSPKKNLSFEGIRVYVIAGMPAFRVQKLERTEPYGKAYPLPLEDIFADYMSENIGEEQAGKKTMQTILEEVEKFFKDSAKAEIDLANSPENIGILFKTSGNDYSSTLLTRP